MHSRRHPLIHSGCCLGRHFTLLLKVDRAAVYGRHSQLVRRSDERSTASARASKASDGRAAWDREEQVLEAALAKEDHVSRLELRRLRLIALSQAMAVEQGGGQDFGGSDTQELGEREVVSCTVVNEGSPFAGQKTLHMGPASTLALDGLSLVQGLQT